MEHLSAKPFRLVSEAADEAGVEAYVIGGYVRDLFLHARFVFASPFKRY